VEDYTDARYSNVKFLTEEAGQKLVRTDNRWLLSQIEDAIEKEPAKGALVK
jgi:hypothetical protein